MALRHVGAILVLIGCGHSFGQDPLPKDVPPLLGLAVVSNRGTADKNSEWSIRLTVPKIAWEVVGEMVPKQKWPELKVDVTKSTTTLRMNGPSQLAPSRILDTKGNELGRDQVLQRLEKETPVLVSVSGRMPDAYYLLLTRPDALVVILGPRDGSPAADLLPAKKPGAANPSKP